MSGGIGIKGIGTIPIVRKGASFGMPPWDFNPALVTFTPGMAKRATTVFAAAPIVQGMKDGTGTPDILSLAAGTAVVSTTFCPNFDANQGSFTLRWIPEYSSGGIATNYHYLFYASSTYYFAYDYTNSWYYLKIGNQTLTVASALTAGTAVNLCFAWDVKNTLDGTNYVRVSINDAHTFGVTTAPTLVAPATTCYIGSNGTAFSCSGIIEGAVIYRRVLYDGTYGVNVGNGDEVNLIAAGVDPTTVTGSWDVCFCLPTNATPGALVTGTGEAWSHPHSSNLLTRGFLSDRYYGDANQWGVAFNGTSTYIDCGSGATLDDLCAGGAIMQVEGWFRAIVTGVQQVIINKGNPSPIGWSLMVTTTGTLIFQVDLATTNVYCNNPTTVFADGKWHHFLVHYDDTAKSGRMAIDGTWGSANVGAGAYVSDAALNLRIGMASAGTNYYFTGSIGWINIYNNAFYTPGTNFVPPRTPTAADVEEWLLNEGTGVTATASVTTPANDGTITAGTWEQQWHDEGTPVMLQSVVGSATYRADVGSGATIDDLADGAFTVEGWFRVPKTGNNQYVCYKGDKLTTGWSCYVGATGLLVAIVRCATTAAIVLSVARVDDNLWHYFKLTFDDAGDRKIYLYVDNVLVATSAAGVGAIVSDAAASGYISDNGSGSTGAYGWIRWSNVVRGAGMIPRSNPPAVDANTMAQWNATDGAGAVLTDSSGNANHGAMAGTYSWNNSPAMESDSPGARNYAWGYVFGIDAPNEGMKQIISGSSVGADYVLRGLAYSEDGLGIPGLVVYDETNDTVLKTVLGTTGSTERAPDLLMCSFELPYIGRPTGTVANCTAFSVKMINALGTGSVVGFQQVELLANLIDNPSMDTGAAADPWIPDGWLNLDVDAGDTEIETVITHSGLASIQGNATLSNEKIYQSIAAVDTNKYYGYGGWIYGSGISSLKVYLANSGHLIPQYLLAGINYGVVNLDASWKIRNIVTRSDAGIGLVYVAADDLGGIRYADDYYLILLDDVSLTCTPASAANSVESSGIRVDGLDSAPQPIPANRLFSTTGWSRIKMIPRHNGADVLKFGNTAPAIGAWWGGANDYIIIDWSSANTLRLRYNANGAGEQSGTWATAGAILAGTTYQLEILYTPTEMKLIVDGTTRITIVAATGFGTIPTSFYPGSLQPGNQQFDAVFLAP